MARTCPPPQWSSQRPKTVQRSRRVPDKLSNEPTAEQVRGLADELAALSKQQSKALQASAYKRMSVEEASEYDRRRVRIAEICAVVGKFKPDR
jgi:hypothetical protein